VEGVKLSLDLDEPPLNPPSFSEELIMGGGRDVFITDLRIGQAESSFSI
jgi:hypothetical protein